VITGAGTTSGVADVLGTDGGGNCVRVVSVVAGAGSIFENPNSVGTVIVGQNGLGRLIVFADGTYSFDGLGLPTGGFTTFRYIDRTRSRQAASRCHA
jgi:hypothetical protein